MKSDGYTSMGGPGRTFQTTHWTAIERVGSRDDVDNEVLLADLFKAYWKPVYCYLRHKGRRNEEAKDLTQGFFQEVVLGRKLIQKADRTEGRFRTLLLRALDHYLVSMHRKETARKRNPANSVISLEEANIHELPEAVDNLESEDVFQYTWVCEMLDRMLEEVEAECRHRGMAVHWDLFFERVLQPILTSSQPPSLESLCRKHGIDAGTKASNMIFAVKRRFQAAAKRLLRQSVASEDQTDKEMLELVKFLAKGRQY
jgi:DNA-directed RNA polymerase specialized sigma24 family protein